MKLTYNTASVDIHPGTGLGLSDKAAQKLRYVKSLYVPKEDRNKGYARALMNQVIDEYSDLSLLVNPDPYDETEVTQKDLIKFYHSLGFRKIQDEPLLMVRHPQPPQLKQSALIIAEAWR